MFLNKSAQFVLGAIVIGASLVTASLNAQAAQLVPGNLTDTQFNQLITSGQFTEKFVTSSRAGNAAVGGTYETGILNPLNNLNPVAQGDYKWVSGQSVAFSLEYDGTTVKYKVGNQVLTSTAFTGNASDIMVRTRAADKTSMLLSNLSFTDTNGTMAMGNLTSAGASGASDVDYLRLAGVSGAFKITGTSMMTWSGARPTNSNLIAQFKVGNSPKAVPEPATMGALVLVAGSAIAARRKSAAKRG
jgi:hypothetical protein